MLRHTLIPLVLALTSWAFAAPVPIAGRAPVGDVMRSLMYHHGYGDRDFAGSVFAGLPEATRRRLGEIDYSAAEQVCPRRLPIAALMKEATELLT